MKLKDDATCGYDAQDGAAQAIKILKAARPLYEQILTDQFQEFHLEISTRAKKESEGDGVVFDNIEVIVKKIPD
jgi:hypothetical protein